MSRLKLRRVLQWDVVVSGASVVVTIVGASWLGDRLGVASWLPLVVGISLIPWVALLAYTANQSQLSKRLVAVIVAGNLTWAVAAAVIIFGFPDSLTTSGKWIVGVLSMLVLDLGVAQAIGLRRITTNPVPSAG